MRSIRVSIWMFCISICSCWCWDRLCRKCMWTLILVLWWQGLQVWPRLCPFWRRIGLQRATASSFPDHDVVLNNMFWMLSNVTILTNMSGYRWKRSMVTWSGVAAESNGFHKAVLCWNTAHWGPDPTWYPKLTLLDIIDTEWGKDSRAGSLNKSESHI